MRILSLGINYLETPPDGLPSYLADFNEHFNNVLNINVVPADGEDRLVNIYNNKVYYIHEKDFFKDGSDVYKYGKLVRAVNTAVNNFKPDITIFHDWMFAPVLNYIDIPSKKIYFCHLFNHGLARATDSYIVDVVKKSEIAMLAFDAIIANSEFTGQEIQKTFGEDTPPVFAVRLGVNKNFYTQAKNLTSKKILYFGRLTAQKGTKLLLQNFLEREEELKKLGLTLEIMGDGDMLEDVARLHFLGKLNYLGLVVDKNKKREIIAQAKYCVFPSVYEPYGLALNEALAMGKVCIATKVGGHMEQIRHGHNGVLENEDFFGVITELENKLKVCNKLADNAVKEASDIKEHFKELEEVLGGIS